jgi:hypothetical protein
MAGERHRERWSSVLESLDLDLRRERERKRKSVLNVHPTIVRWKLEDESEASGAPIFLRVHWGYAISDLTPAERPS